MSDFNEERERMVERQIYRDPGRRPHCRLSLQPRPHRVDGILGGSAISSTL